MTHEGNAPATRLIPDWETLRPHVTETLLAQITRRIVEQFQPDQVVLFGSHVYGRPDLESDVDLLVVMEWIGKLTPFAPRSLRRPPPLAVAPARGGCLPQQRAARRSAAKRGLDMTDRMGEDGATGVCWGQGP